ncbi:MAG TPA: von Willebrand factor type A domain-containing protein [Planctomycetaceae bacterium]
MSENQLLPDDPRLTAYALGELDPTEQAALERLLAGSPAAQAAVREIRELAGVLTTELRQEPALELTARQREAILVAGTSAGHAASAPVNHAPVNHAPNNSEEFSVMLGLPDPPVPLRPRATHLSVKRFAALATIAALIVVAAVIIPPPRQSSDLARGRIHGISEPHDVAFQFDSLTTDGFAMPEAEGVGLGADVTALSASPSDGAVRFRERTVSQYGMKAGVAGRGDENVSGETGSGLEPSQKVASLEQVRSQQKGMASFGIAGSSSGGRPGGMTGAPGGGPAGGFGAGGGVASSTNKPNAPLAGEPLDRSYSLHGRKLSSGRKPAGTPAKGKADAAKSTESRGVVAQNVKRLSQDSKVQTGPVGDPQLLGMNENGGKSQGGAVPTDKFNKGSGALGGKGAPQRPQVLYAPPEGETKKGRNLTVSSGGKSGGRAGDAGGERAEDESTSDGSKVAAVDRFGVDKPGVDKLRTNVRDSMFRAEGLARTDPAAARKLIEDAESTVKNSAGVDGKSSAQLLKSLAKSREYIDHRTKLASSPELARRNAEVEARIKVEEGGGIRLEESLAEKVDSYNKLLKEKRFDDAIVVGKQVQEQMPDNPLPELMVAKAKLAKQEASNPIAREAKVNLLTRQLADLDVAELSDSLEYPTQEEWKKLAERRQRYKRSEAPGTEVYEPIVENQFFSAYEDPLSTFGVDVDTASYANVRRFLTDQQLPPPNAVRIEEMVNYFSYSYPQPAAGQPFSVNVEAANCPWTPGHQLVRIALKGKEIPRDQRPASNLVFLVDVSGSMQAENKLPLVKMGLNLLTQQMTESDQVAIVTYSDSAVQRLEATNGTNKPQITQVIDSLQAAGSTNGAAGIQLAYRAAVEHFIDGGTNRVILCTDGDFNVGVSDDDQLVKMIQGQARTKVFFSVFGFGMGNLKDGKLEKLADKGNGHYAYIDGQREAQKMFVDELVGTLVTIAKDVKLQVEFNPNQVGAYRLIGYENRVMASQDFNNDKKDAGEIGAGHTVTTLYEIVPAGEAPKPQLGDSLRYRKAVVPQEGEVARELLSVKLRYKLPEADVSTLLEFPAAAPGAAHAGLAGQPDASAAWYSFQLKRTDADAAAKSLGALFGASKPALGNDKNDKEAPVIEADAANGRLFFRGSTAQISQVRKLLVDLGEPNESASRDFNWAAAVAAFGMILRDSQFRGQANFDMVLELAQSAKGEDKSGQRAEFIELVKKAKALYQPDAPRDAAAEPPLTFTREQAEAKASVNGKYKNLLRIVPAPGDAAALGSFQDYGHWEGTSYLGHDNLPPGYWVYVAPNWYIWGDE